MWFILDSKSYEFTKIFDNTLKYEQILLNKHTSSSIKFKVGNYEILEIFQLLSVSDNFEKQC